MRKKRPLAAAFAACLALTLSSVPALAAGHRFEQVSDDPADNWVCSHCGGVATPELKDAYEIVSAQNGRQLSRDVPQVEQDIRGYVERMTARTLDSLGWFMSSVSTVSYTAPYGGRDGVYRYTVAIQSYGRSNPLFADITTEPLTLVVPSLEEPAGPDQKEPAYGNTGLYMPVGSWGGVYVNNRPLTPEQQAAYQKQMLMFVWIAQNHGKMNFSDVAAGSWYYEGVDYVRRNALMSGVSQGIFAPDEAVSRGMIWVVLARMNGLTTDVGPGGVWYDRGRDYVVRQGWADGTEDPDAAATREELTQLLWMRAGGPLVPADLSRFSDSGQVQAKNAMRWAVANGILQGSGGRLMPQGSVTRAELAVMVMRCAAVQGRP